MLVDRLFEYMFLTIDEPSCATTSHKRPPIHSTEFFPDKALQLKPLVYDHLMHCLTSMFTVCTMLFRIYEELKQKHATTHIVA